MIPRQLGSKDVGSEEHFEMNLGPLLQVALPDRAGRGPAPSVCDAPIIVFLHYLC
jgi:hypothetical protein